MPNAYISGTGSYVPPRVVTNEQLAAEFGIDTTDEWIFKRTGIRERRFADEGVGSADLGTEAAKAAIENAGIDKTDLDMILFATLSPDRCFPGSGVFLQDKLGLPGGENPKFVPALDIRNQCSGFLYGLATGSAMIEAGRCKHVLLVGAEVHSAALDLSTKGRTVASLFGDGAGAVVLSATEDDRGLRYWHLGADGRFRDVLCQRVWDISKRPFIALNEDGDAVVPADSLWPYMEGRVVFKNAVEKMIMAIMQACWETKTDLKEIDIFAFHQANMRINQYVAQQLQIPDEKLIHNIHKYGNTTAATIPLLLDEAARSGRIQPGMKVAMVAFGSGFTWGAAIVDW